MEKVLVTGGLGYIGSHTTVALIEAGFDVVVVDSLANSSVEVLDRIQTITGVMPPFEKIDLCDKDHFKQFLGSDIGNGISSVIHFAAFKNVGESVANPTKYYDNNVGSMSNLLELAPDFGILQLVFSSSCSVYGDPDEVPVTEASPIKEASSPYGDTKIICEKMLQDASDANKINCICLRYFNPIGAHPSGNLGEIPGEFADNIMPALTKTAMGTHQEMKIYGGDYDTEDGTCVRDYIEIMDLANAHLNALRRLDADENTSKFEIFNLGTGKGVSVLEIIQTFEEVTGKKIPYSIVEKRPGDVEEVYADPTLANDELKWKAQKNLRDMIQTAWEWQKNMSKKDE